MTPLHFAARAGNPDSVEYLLAKKVNPNAADRVSFLNFFFLS